MSVVRIFTDGGSRGNPGLSAAAIYIPQAGLGIGFPLADTTNNVAEYRALIFALSTAIEAGFKEVEIVSDSELMVKQMRKAYRVYSEVLLPLWTEATILAEELDLVVYTHVRRAENKVADSVANQTMDKMKAGELVVERDVSVEFETPKVAVLCVGDLTLDTTP